MHPIIGEPDRAALKQAMASGNRLLRRAQLLLLCRRRRTEVFDPGMFDEPAWDGLLVLYVEEKAGLTATVARLAELIGARVPILLRWIEYLEEQGLVIRTGFRGPAASVALTEKGRCDLELYLSGISALSSE